MSGSKENKYRFVPDVQYITPQNSNLNDRLSNCKKQAYHTKHISIGDFFQNSCKDYLSDWSSITTNNTGLEELLPGLLKNMTGLTCHICVKYEDGKSSTGSGLILRIRRQNSDNCPCHTCNGKIVKPFAIITVTTVLHVFAENPDVTKRIIVAEWKPKNVKVNLFYDNPDIEQIKSLDGYRLLDTDKEMDLDSDWCAIECVTHDMELVVELEHVLNTYMDLQAKVYEAFSDLKSNDRLVIIIGHPHGGPKKISVGTYDKGKTKVLKDVRNYQRWCRYEYNILTCFGSSGSPVFIIGQPLCGFGYWFGHPHNHSKGDDKAPIGYSSVGVEHIIDDDHSA